MLRAVCVCTSGWRCLIRSVTSPAALLISFTISQTSFFFLCVSFASSLSACALLQLLDLILSPTLDWTETVCGVFPRGQSACCSAKFALSKPSSPSVSELSEFLLGVLGHSDNTAVAFGVCESTPSQNVRGNHVAPRHKMLHRWIVLVFVGCVFCGLFTERE